MTQSDFAGLNLSPEVFQAVTKQGYTIPTEIQALAIPPVLTGEDVIGHAKTGTGKTAAFALPLLCRIDTSKPYPQVCVLAPTRELAIQVAEAFSTYASSMPNFRVATIYGGAAYGPQISQLKRGAQIVVGTPGRVIDHMKKGNLKLDKLDTFVLDEADEMLNMGFAEDVKWVLSQAKAERQTLLFSATMPENVRRIADRYLTNPTRISLHSDTMTTSTVDQRVCAVANREKISLITRILEAETTEGVIVFVKTKEMSSRLSEILCQRGYRASALNGDMKQQQRERTVEQLKAGRLNILVATDVAARGLDVERISHVINYDFPHDPQAYVHRIGRTGRAGREGHAILFLDPREKSKLRRLEKVTGQKMTWMEKPSHESIQANRQKKLQEKIVDIIAKRNLDKCSQMLNKFLAENEDLTMPQIAAALVSLATKGDDTSTRAKDRDTQAKKPHREDRHPKEGKFSSQRDRVRIEREDRNMPPGAFAKKSSSSYDDEPASPTPRKGKFQSKDRRGGTSSRMIKYRIEVGWSHGVRPRNIVGAIANESGLEGSQIGGIDIQTDYSTVDLPNDMTDELFQGLRKLRVAGQALQISRWDRNAPGNVLDKPRKFKRKKSKLPGKKKSKKAGKVKLKAKAGVTAS